MHQLIGHWRRRLGRPGKRVELEEDHWAVILALQEFVAHHDDSKQVNRRLLHDALNEKFHHKGASLICTGCFPGALLRKVVDWPVWRHQPAVWTDPKEAPHNCLHLQPWNAGVLYGRPTANRFKSIIWAVRSLITSRL